MVKTRVDVHRPKEMCPGDYRYLASSYPAGEDDTGRPVIDWEGTEEWKELGRPMLSTCEHAREGKCDHCGAWHIYATILLYVPTGEILSVGQTCAVERFGRADWKNVIADGARRAELRREREAKRAAAWSALSEEGREAFLWAEGDGCPNRIAQDIAGKVTRFGPLTGKQEAFLVKLWQETQEKAKAIEEGTKVPCPSGKVEITGKIVSSKVEEFTISRWASKTVFKCLIEDDRGFRVWGTCPSACLEWCYQEDRRRYDAGEECKTTAEYLKGMRVAFVASVEPSEKDPCFGIYSRPTKVKVLE